MSISFEVDKLPVILTTNVWPPYVQDVSHFFLLGIKVRVRPLTSDHEENKVCTTKVNKSNRTSLLVHGSSTRL